MNPKGEHHAQGPNHTKFIKWVGGRETQHTCIVANTFDAYAADGLRHTNTRRLRGGHGLHAAHYTRLSEQRHLQAKAQGLRSFFAYTRLSQKRHE